MIALFSLVVIGTSGLLFGNAVLTDFAMFAASFGALLCCLYAITETLKTSLLNAGIAGSAQYTGANGAIYLGITVNTGTTDQKTEIAFGYATVQLVYLLSPVNMRVCVNAIHSGSPLVTWNLLAGIPFIWQNDGNTANPFSTTDVTAFYCTNASGTNATLTGEILY
jgi:hypothetical protein